MDPVSQGVTGAIAAQLAGNENNIKVATWIGLAGGMAADLDIFIHSSSDQLMNLMMHRHFTHSIAFIPVAALIAWCISPLLKRFATPFQTVLFFTLGYASHGFLDILTSYGTYFLWPFSSSRVAFDFIPIMDFSFTLPILLFLLMRYLRINKRKWTFAALIWLFGYIMTGFVQHQRARQNLNTYIQSTHSSSVTKARVIPTIGNLTLWRGIYVNEGRIHAIGIKAGFVESTRIIEGASVKLFQQNPFPIDSNAGNDIERFREFCHGYVGVDEKTGELLDMRYSILPQSNETLWGLRLPSNATGHCCFVKYHRRDKRNLIKFLDTLMGTVTTKQDPQPKPAR